MAKTGFIESETRFGDLDSRTGLSSELRWRRDVNSYNLRSLVAIAGGVVVGPGVILTQEMRWPDTRPVAKALEVLVDTDPWSLERPRLHLMRLAAADAGNSPRISFPLAETMSGLVSEESQFMHPVISWMFLVAMGVDEWMPTVFEDCRQQGVKGMGT
jgi:hypothetical protein